MAHHIKGVIARTLPASQNPPGSRLKLAAEPDHRGEVDGGWWPRSRDSASELSELLATLTVRLGAITRLTVGAKDWDNIPHRIAVGDRVVKVGWVPDLDHLIIVTRRQDEFLLLVVPSEADADAAHRALDQAAAGTGGGRPAEILAGCDIGTGPRPHGSDGGKPVLRLVPAETTNDQQPGATDDSQGERG